MARLNGTMGAVQRFSAPLLDRLVSCHEFDVAGSLGLDSHGTHHGTLVNTPTQGTGKVGAGALQCTAASSQYISVPNAADLPGGDTNFAVACWVLLDSKTVDRAIVSRDVNTTTNRQWLLYYDQASDRFRWIISPDGNTPNQKSVSASALGSPSLSTWYFVVTYHDSGRDLIGISGNAGVFNTTSTSVGVFAGTSAYEIGAIQAHAKFLDGRIDQACLWNRIPSTAEQTFLYNNGLGRSYQEIRAYSAFQIHLWHQLDWLRKQHRPVPRELARLLPRLPRHQRGVGHTRCGGALIRTARSGAL